MAQQQRDDVALALRTVVERLGPDVGREPARLRGLLHDVLGARARASRQEIAAVVAAAGGQTAGTEQLDDDLRQWGQQTYASAVRPPGPAEGPTALPPTHLPPPAAPPTDGRAEPTALPPAPSSPAAPHSAAGPEPGPASGPVSGPAPEPAAAAVSRPRRRRALPVLLVAAGVSVALVGGGVVAGTWGDDGTSEVLSTGPGSPSPRASTPTPSAEEPTTPAEGSGASPSPTGAQPLTECPEPAGSTLHVDYDIRRGIDFHGQVASAAQQRALLQSVTATGVAIEAGNYLTVGASEAAGPTVATLAALVPALVENLADGRAVVTGDQVCVAGRYIDDVAAAQLQRSADRLGAGTAPVTLLVEPHPADNHALHVEILQMAITLALDNERIPFATGKADLLPAADPILDRLVRVMNERFPEDRFPGLVVTVEGHTDDVGTRESNLRLSLARAQSVRAALIARGVAPGRLIAVGHGPDEPLTTNATEEGRAVNRRVVFNVGRDHSHGVGDAGGSEGGHGEHSGH